MTLNVFLYGYCLPLVICLISAGWFKWFSDNPKASLSTTMATIFAFIPVLNIGWAVNAVWFTPIIIKEAIELRYYIKQNIRKPK